MRQYRDLSACAYLLICLAALTHAQDAPHTPLSPYWSVSASPSPVYWFHDPEPTDLFRYHQQDSNRDGIDNVRLSHDDQFLIIRSQGYPNHPTGKFPNDSNPNRIEVQDFTFRLPLKPQRATNITTLPMGPIGVALNGVVFFNPFEAGGMNAVEGYSEVWLDSCCGHPQQHGVYHYHKYPTCVRSPFKDDGKQHSPVIGFAFDGYPIYGPYESDGAMARDVAGSNALDPCNGHEDPVRGYHYHVTPGKFPYVIGGYRGVVEASNSRGLRHASRGAITNNASGASRLPDAIHSISPAELVRGKTHQLTLQLNDIPRLPPGTPSWLQFGPHEASNLARSGRVITATIHIPADASTATALDGHLEFADEATTRPPRVFKQNNALRILSE